MPDIQYVHGVGFPSFFSVFLQLYNEFMRFVYDFYTHSVPCILM